MTAVEAGYGSIVQKSIRGRLILLVVLSLAVAAVVAFILSLIETRTDFSLLGLYVWFIVPLGAIVCGMAAAGGYFLAARLFHIRPSHLFGIVFPVVLGLLVYGLTHYFTFRAVGRSGEAFLDFYRDRLASTRYQIGSGSGQTVDGLGYALAVLNVLGVAVGGWMVSSFLRSQHYCDDCGRYLSKQGSVAARFKEGADYLAMNNRMFDALHAGQHQMAWQALADAGDQGKLKRSHETAMNVFVCSTCSRQWVEVTGGHQQGRNWNTDFKVFGLPEDYVRQGMGDNRPRV